MDFAKREQDDDRQPFLPKTDDDIPSSGIDSRKAILTSTKYLRLILEIAMAMVIVVLFIWILGSREVVKPSPVPKRMCIASSSCIMRKSPLTRGIQFH